MQLVNGETVIVEQVQHELLESPETLYNFSVDGNHNYYVAESVDVSVYDFVLAHNNYCSDYNDYSPEYIENKYNLPKGMYHKKIKSEILKVVADNNNGKLPYFVGKNPKIG